MLQILEANGEAVRRLNLAYEAGIGVVIYCRGADATIGGPILDEVAIQ